MLWKPMKYKRFIIYMFIPPTMVKVEKSSKDIRKERIKDILKDLQFGDISQAKNKLDKYFDK